MKRILRTAALSLCLFAAETALAADGFVTGDVELRAGPDPGYPSVAMLSDGTSVSIMGCVDNWSWCDVATSADRGWVPGDFLQEEYQGQRVFVPEYAAVIGIPVVTFTFAAYWDAHYRQRPFYAERERYVRVQPAFRPPAHRPQTQQPRAQPPQPANQGRAAAVPQEHPASPQNRLPQKEEINSGKRMEPQARPNEPAKNEPANASSRPAPAPAERRAPETNHAAGQPKATPKPAAKPAAKPQQEKGKEDKGKEEKKDQQG